ncbi:MAG: DUF4262 domain-containing protein [Phycisphaerales bacterium]
MTNPPPPEYDPHEQPVLDDIAKYGWSGIIIEKDDEGPGFEYTVGLMAKFDHPEVIVFGCKRETGHGMLWAIVRGIEEGTPFTAGIKHNHVLEGYPCESRLVHESQHPEYLGYAIWHHRHFGKLGPLRAVQCVWPDRDGRFPGEPGCDANAERDQPDLRQVLPTQPRP